MDNVERDAETVDEKRIFAQLNGFSHTYRNLSNKRNGCDGFDLFFREIPRERPIAYGLESAVRQHSKIGIEALEIPDYEKAKEHFESAKIKFDELRSLVTGPTIEVDLKRCLDALKGGDQDQTMEFLESIASKFHESNLLWIAPKLSLGLYERLKFQAGQEYVELHAVLTVLPYIEGTKELEDVLASLLEPDELMVSPQEFLAGWGDVPSEISKKIPILFMDSLEGEMIRARLRLVNLSRAIRSWLSSFMEAQPAVLNPIRDPKGGNPYSSRLRRTASTVLRQCEEIRRERKK